MRCFRAPAIEVALHPFDGDGELRHGFFGKPATPADLRLQVELGDTARHSKPPEGWHNTELRPAAWGGLGDDGCGSVHHGHRACTKSTPDTTGSPGSWASQALSARRRLR